MSLSPPKIAVGLFISFISGYLISQFFSVLFPSDSNQNNVLETTGIDEKYISVEVAGAVVNPGVYELKEASRVVDAIQISGGFSDGYDIFWVGKNLNLSEMLKDEQKIFIPYLALGYSSNGGGCSKEVFIPVGKNLNETQESTSSGELPDNNSSSATTTDDKLNVNESTLDELDTLPGIGPVYAEKIVASRPYSDLEDFRTRSKLSASVVEKIKDLITF